MKAYLLFAGSKYYPSGGAQDFQGFFDSIDDAVTFFEQNNQLAQDYSSSYRSEWDWYHVAQPSDMSICASGNSGTFL